MLVTLSKSVDEKCGCTLKNVDRTSKNDEEKMFATFLKNVYAKILKKVKSRRYLGDFKASKWVILGLRGFYSSHAYPPSGSYIGAPNRA
jgi:hypothetical protein